MIDYLGDIDIDSVNSNINKTGLLRTGLLRKGVVTDWLLKTSR